MSDSKRCKKPMCFEFTPTAGQTIFLKGFSGKEKKGDEFIFYKPEKRTVRTVKYLSITENLQKWKR